MGHIFLNRSIYYLNIQEKAALTFDRSTWVLAQEITPGLLSRLRDSSLRAIFIQRGNIFSHAVNVLRRALLGTDIAVVIGLGDILHELSVANAVTVDMCNNTITLSDRQYHFNQFDYLKDTSEVLELDLSSSELCYKPDYYYHPELADIIVRGYQDSNLVFPQRLDPRACGDGRIWCREYMLPHQITEYFSQNLPSYYTRLSEYAAILRRLLCYEEDNTEKVEIKSTLSLHFAYSLIFSFNTANISELIVTRHGADYLETIYAFFIKHSPIYNKSTQTEIALNKIGLLMAKLSDGEPYSESLRAVYGDHAIVWTELATMFFVNNMFSDVRRCVINSFIERNRWFASICGHRKKQNLY